MGNYGTAPQALQRTAGGCRKMEREGKAVIIRPQIPLTIDKFDIKPHKLLALHDHGIGCGLAAIDRIKELEQQ